MAKYIEMIERYRIEQGIDTDYKSAILPMVDNLGELVRCKDCKHSEHWYRDKCRCFLWAEDGIDVFDDGFCNYAERRQDG